MPAPSGSSSLALVDWILPIEIVPILMPPAVSFSTTSRCGGSKTVQRPSSEAAFRSYIGAALVQAKMLVDRCQWGDAEILLAPHQTGGCRSGRPATLQMSLSAKPTLTMQFFLPGKDGPGCRRCACAAPTLDREFLEFVGEVELPAKPFRVAVAGVTQAESAREVVFRLKRRHPRCRPGPAATDRAGDPRTAA